MTVMIQDRDIARKFIQQRRESGNDRWDEVWDGVYVLMPNPNVEHQDLATGLAAIFRTLFDWSKNGKTYQGVNVSNQSEDWTRNYRCPDVAVYLSGTPAALRGAYMLGGPDFAVEIISPEDRSRQKFDFYASVGVRELLLVDREPWALELYRRRETEWELVGTSRLDRPQSLNSAVLPLSFRLEAGETRPVILVNHSDGIQKWSV
jgi:Uma2 family endonuclease